MSNFKLYTDFGKGKNQTRMASTPLDTTDDVNRWLKEKPIRSNTQVTVENLNTGQRKTATKTHWIVATNKR